MSLRVVGDDDQAIEDADAAHVVIGIETDRGPGVKALVAAGYTAYPIDPSLASS